jgi:S-adenosylmethionine decarboxylase
MFPDRQLFPHTDWNDEVNYMDQFFDNGAAYMVGKTNGNHWYCFLYESSNNPIPAPDEKDYTLEILMTQLDEDNSKMFIKDQATDKDGALIASQKLQAIYNNNVQMDDFAFDPCGYSCNALTKDGFYFTVHVTPEAHCSYASFETNIPPTNEIPYSQVVSQVVNIFKPGKFTVTLFSEKDYADETAQFPLPFKKKLEKFVLGNEVKNYHRLDRIHYEFDVYDLVFYQYKLK